jgi:hypothetical protein
MKFGTCNSIHFGFVGLPGCFLTEGEVSFSLGPQRLFDGDYDVVSGIDL